MKERNRYREQAVKFQQKYKTAKKDCDVKRAENILLKRENTSLNKKIKQLKEILDEENNCVSY